MPLAAIAVTAIGGLILAVGLWGTLDPRALQSWLLNVDASRRLAMAVGVRVAFGVALVIAAPASGFPNLLMGLGILALFAAVVLLALGVKRLDSFIRYWADLSPGYVRPSCVGAAAFGAFLIYSVVGI